MHAEAVLFIDDHQAQAVKRYILLEQGVGADHQPGLAAGDTLQRCLPLLPLGAAAQPLHADRQRLEPVAETAPVLFRQYFCGRHHGDLVAVGDRLQCCPGGDQGLARAHITLHQPQHGNGLGQVGGDLCQYPLLGAGRCEGQAVQEVRHQRCAGRERRGALRPLLLAQALQRQVVGHQLLQRQALLGRVLAFPQLGLGSVRRRRVQVVEGAGQVVGVAPRRQQVAGRVAPQPRQGLAAQVAPLVLADALGGGVDGRERLLDRWLALIQWPVFGVEHLQSAAAAPHLPEAAQAGAGLEVVFLGGGKMEEAQGQGAGAILDAGHQAAAPAEYHVGGAHLALYHQVRALPGGRYRGDAGAVLVAQGQVEQQIVYPVHAIIGQPGGELGTDPPQLTHRDSGNPGHRNGRGFGVEPVKLRLPCLDTCAARLRGKIVGVIVRGLGPGCV